MGRPRVLINALSLTLGGGRSYLRNLLRELARDPRGFEFTVLAAEGQLSSEEASGIPLEVLRLSQAPPSLRSAARVLYEEVALPLRARAYDLLYCVADLAPAVACTPTVVLLRNLNIYDRRFYDDRRTRTLYRLARIGVRRCREIVCPTRAAADAIAPCLGIASSRIRVVPHGIAAEAFEAPPAAAPAATVPYLFVSASVERHKNLEVVIEALVRQGDPALELWVAGSVLLDPGYAAEVRGLVERRGVASRVHFLGSIPYRDMLGYYRGATAFVFPSRIETFGHPLLEAMLAGAPIVASDIPAFREIAEGVALFFPQDDPDALVRAIEATRADPEAARARVARGHERAAEFSWGRSVDALCRVFADALLPR